MTELVGYCFHCSNGAMWDDEKQKMICMAYHDGIPDSMWKRVEAGKNCLYYKKDRLLMETEELERQRNNMETTIIPDEDYDRVLEKMFSIIFDKENLIDKTVKMRGREFEKWLEKNYKKKD